MPDQPLVHTYDGKTCRYVGLAGFTVSEPIRDLGNISLLEYHRQKGEVSEQVLNAIPPETPAISVKYGSERPGNTFIGAHIPDLLKKTFTKDDVESTVFNAQVLSIDGRVKRGIEEIERLNNSGGLRIPGLNITFNTTPYRPEPQRNFAEQRQNNLNFGGGYFCSYPSQALRQRKLLEKPNKIATVVFYPEQDKTKQINFETWCNRFKIFVKSFEIDLQLEYRSYILRNTIEIQRKCRNLQNYELAIMFVPDKEKYINEPKADPYPILKGEFVKAILPSQAIEGSTFRSAFNDTIGYNLLLQI